MGRHVIRVMVLGIGAAIAGCASPQPGAELSKPPTEGPQTGRLASEAAATRFPQDATASNELKVTAVVDRKAHTISLRNFGDRPLNDVEVWVNGSYVRCVPLLPARGGLVIHFAQFYSPKGVTLDTQQINVTRVQLREGNKLYNAMGPAYE